MADSSETSIQPKQEENDYSQDQSNENEVIGSAALRPVFLGNLQPEYSTERVEKLFTEPIQPTGSTETFKSIPVDRVDVKRGFCFVFLKDAASQEDKEQVEKFVIAINGMELDQVSSALRAEFARGDGRVKRKEDDRRRNIQPSETLFVVNFHEETTKQEDLKMLFEPYGELVRIDMKRNYAFVQFRTVEEATRALEATNGGKLDQSVLSVEYVARRRGDQDRRRRRDDFRGDRRGGYDRRGPPPDRFRRGPSGGDRMSSRGYSGDPERNDRDRYYDEPPRRPPPRDDYRPRGRERSPGGYRGSPPAGYRPRDAGSYRRERGISPGDGGYGIPRSRSRSRSPRGGYRSRSPPRRYDERDTGSRVGRYDDYRDRRVPPPGPAGAYSPEEYRGRSPEGNRG